MLTTYLLTGVIGGEDVVVTPPTGLLAAFRLRYPAFAAVSDDSVTLWLDEGVLEVAAWATDLQDRGAMLYGAHQLASQGLGTGAIPTGATSFKSGTFSLSLSDSAASRTGFNATIYGREYLALARRQFAGPRLAWTPPAAAY